MSEIFDSIIVSNEIKQQVENRFIIMSKLESLQAQLITETDFMKKAELLDEIRKLEGKETVNTCELGSECENCSG